MEGEKEAEGEPVSCEAVSVNWDSALKGIILATTVNQHHWENETVIQMKWQYFLDEASDHPDASDEVFQRALEAAAFIFQQIELKTTLDRAPKCPRCRVRFPSATHVAKCKPCTPINWDPLVTYTSTSISCFAKARPLRRSRSDVEIRWIKHKAHPCCDQRGLFATTQIDKDKLLGEYSGLMRYKNPDSESDYIAQTDDATAWWVDAEKVGNEFRYMNHFEGTLGACEKEDTVVSGPNAQLRWVYRTARVEVWTLATILPDEEIVIDYGPGYYKSNDSKEPT